MLFCSEVGGNKRGHMSSYCILLLIASCLRSRVFAPHHLHVIQKTPLHTNKTLMNCLSSRFIEIVLALLCDELSEEKTNVQRNVEVHIGTWNQKVPWVGFSNLFILNNCGACSQICRCFCVVLSNLFMQLCWKHRQVATKIWWNWSEYFQDQLAKKSHTHLLDHRGVKVYFLII